MLIETFAGHHLEEDKENDDWTVRADVPEESGDFSEVILCIREFLRIRVHEDDEVQ
jgi:hypothetical protein